MTERLDGAGSADGWTTVLLIHSGQTEDLLETSG